MKTFNKKDRGFHQSNKAHYADVIGHIETMIGIYPGDGNQGTCGEFAIRWIKVGTKVPPQLQVFDDAFKALSSMPDLIQALANMPEDFTQDDLKALLLSIGFRDLTAYALITTPYLTYVDEQDNKGECTLVDFIDANKVSDGSDRKEINAIKKIKVGQTIRLNGWMGMYTDVTRIR